MNFKRGAVLISLLLMVAMLCAFGLITDNKDKVAFFEDVMVPGDVTNNGDAVAIFGNVMVDGTLRGDAVAVFGSVTVRGEIDGDVVAVLGTVRVRDNGVISGDTVGIGGGVEKGPNAVIRGEIADVSTPFSLGEHGLIPRVGFGDMMGLFVIYAFSCLVVLIAPDRVRMMTETIREKTARKLAIGSAVLFLYFPAFAIVCVLLAITIVGILLIPFVAVAAPIIFFVGIFMGFIAMSIALGYKITGSLEGRNSIYIHLLVGCTIIYIIKLVPILGALTYVALGAYALGIAVDTRLGSPVRKQASNV